MSLGEKVDDSDGDDDSGDGEVRIELRLNEPTLAPAFHFPRPEQRVLATTIYRRLIKFFSKGVRIGFRRETAARSRGLACNSIKYECDEMLELAELCTKAMRRALAMAPRTRRAWARERIDEALTGNVLPCDPETESILTAAAHATVRMTGPRHKSYVTLVADGAPPKFDADELHRVIAAFFEPHIGRQLPETAKSTEAHVYAVALAGEITKRVLHGERLEPDLQLDDLDRVQHRQRDDVRRRRIGEVASRRPRSASK